MIPNLNRVSYQTESGWHNPTRACASQTRSSFLGGHLSRLALLSGQVHSCQRTREWENLKPFNQGLDSITATTIFFLVAINYTRHKVLTDVSSRRLSPGINFLVWKKPSGSYLLVLSVGGQI